MRHVCACVCVSVMCVTCRQVVRVWRLVPHNDVAGTVRRLEKAHAVYTDEYLERYLV